jgi:hypothetical protein
VVVEILGLLDRKMKGTPTEDKPSRQKIEVPAKSEKMTLHAQM